MNISLLCPAASACFQVHKNSTDLKVRLEMPVFAFLSGLSVVLFVGKRVTGLPEQPEPRTRGMKHFPPSQREFYTGVRMDRKIQVQDPRTGGRYSNLRSGTYHFNDLYGNVRSEVWKPEQSRTFSHHVRILKYPW
jgi:hypothetical protein